ncbi:MAG TPA: glycogen debranching N-terminal domain-containing protein [Thermoleophilaceae bacterium]|nr:glycogen debranching N-terminal domain-containing protein [Thermoleophilaceae bacterium]
MGEAGFNIDDAVVIKLENLFLVTPRDGALPLRGRHAFGLYYNDCRFLSGWQLRVLGQTPRPLAGSDAAGDSASYELRTSDLSIRIERELIDGRTLDERITIRSFADRPVSGDVVLQTRSGFEPIMWLRGVVDDYRPRRPAAAGGDSGVTASVTGRDGIARELATTARPAPDVIEGQTLTWKLELRRRRPRTITLRHVATEGERPRRRRRVPRSDSDAPRTSVTTDSELFNRVLERSFADLRMLRSRHGGDSYYAAGIPWFATVFGRDTLITSIEMLAYDQRIAEQTLRLLAANLGTTLDDERDEEPGKVLHELRVGELANLGILPFARYFGSVDSTPLFLCLLAEYTDWAGDLALFRELRAEVDAALAWIDEWGDRDGDGLLEYRRRSARGLASQGWKDSPGGVPDERGRPLAAPVALIEPQGYVMRAKGQLARLFDLADEPQRAERLRAEVRKLSDDVERFWLQREGFYAMALDGDKRAGRALASNQGHALWASAVPPDRAAAVRDALMRPELFSGWGIRTLSSAERSYNPLGYHTGSVWPHDTALTAIGLRTYGYDEDFVRVFDGLLEAASRFGDYRLPELFGGFSRSDYDVPVPYPVACRPQAWAAGSLPYMLRASLGLTPDGLEQRLRIVRPSLPAWLSHVELRGLEVAGSRIDLTIDRDGDAATLADVRVDGDVEVVLESGEPPIPGLPSP